MAYFVSALHRMDACTYIPARVVDSLLLTGHLLHPPFFETAFTVQCLYSKPSNLGNGTSSANEPLMVSDCSINIYCKEVSHD